MPTSTPLDERTPIEKARDRLLTDDTFYAEKCLKIVDQDEQLVPLRLKPAQRRLVAVKAQQEREGKPVRILILKARKEGLCLDPSTRVLTEDLRWVPIDSVAPGDRLIATDEEPPGGKGHHRRMRVATVEAKRAVRKRAYRLRMSDGRELIATAGHRFLTKRGRAMPTWRSVERMKPGTDEIRHITEPWEEPAYKDGWFGGFLDGEGTVRRKERAGCEMVVTQRPGPTCDRARRYLVDGNYTMREEIDNRTMEEAPGRFGDNPVLRLGVGRMNEIFRLVGQTRPTRFLRSDWWEGKELPGKRSGCAWASVVSIEELNVRRMIDLQTDTKTFIAEGFVSHNSTMVQGLMIKRITQRKNHKAMVVAHDSDTATQIFEMGEMMHSQLPDEMIAGLQVKPPVVSGQAGKEIKLGEPSRVRRQAGHTGLNSSYYVDTAGSYESGRGFTLHSLHLSEFALYQNPEKKSKALFNAVPDLPGTMIVIESTADGYNLFRKLWVAAVRGDSAYFPLFIAWFEDPQYSMPFANSEEREDFIQTIGRGEYGEDEPELVETGVTPEQLKWRRWAIQNKANGDIRAFWQEYPAKWEEAFLATGRQVFSPALVAKVIAKTERTDPIAQRGVIQPQTWEKSTYMKREIEVPANPLWIPDGSKELAVATPRWQRWELPDPGLKSADPETRRPPGQYVIFVDSASGAETASEGSDYFAIQVINHRTLEQVAVWHARGIDTDKVAEQVYLVALLYSITIEVADGSTRTWRPWVGIETTGGYGLSIADKMWRVWKYAMLYFRRPADQKGERQENRLGWSTNVKTKPLLVDHGKELLRTGHHGVRHKGTAAEMQTFVKDEKGKMGAEEDYFDDLLDAWLGAQMIANEKSLRRVPDPSQTGPRSRMRPPSMNVRPHTLSR